MMRKKVLKIAMLGHKSFPSREGGIEVVVAELCTRMAKRGHRVTSFVRHGVRADVPEDHTPGEITVVNGVIVREVPCLQGRGLEALTASVTAAAQAAFGDYDVVHFHAEGPCAMIWLPKLFGKRCVATIHGLDWQREKWKGGLGSKYIRFGEKMAAKYADEIIVLSRENQRYFREIYGRKTRYIPNGIDRPKTRPAELIQEQWELEKDGYYLYLGRVVPEKRAELLIRAFLRTDSKRKLVIAGAASDTEAYYEMIRKLAAEDDRIILTGFVSGQPLEELYSNAYAFVLPSDLEGMPMSLLEAMSYGNCCLTSDIAECADVMKGHGMTFAKGDEDALREALERLDADPELVERYRTAASDYICGRFDWEKITDKTLELYRL